jgi:hypothetical protein
MTTFVKPLSELVTEFYSLSRPVGTVIALEQAQQLAVDAARFFGAYGSFEIAQAPPDPCRQTPTTPATFAQVSDIGKVDYPETITVGADVYVTLGEWAIIRPLFVLYVERENAIHLESTRGLGADVFGRSSDVITDNIKDCEQEVMERAFNQKILSV